MRFWFYWILGCLFWSWPSWAACGPQTKRVHTLFQRHRAVQTSHFCSHLQNRTWAEPDRDTLNVINGSYFLMVVGNLKSIIISCKVWPNTWLVYSTFLIRVVMTRVRTTQNLKPRKSQWEESEEKHNKQPEKRETQHQFVRRTNGEKMWEETKRRRRREEMSRSEPKRRERCSRNLPAPYHAATTAARIKWFTPQAPHAGSTNIPHSDGSATTTPELLHLQVSRGPSFCPLSAEGRCQTWCHNPQVYPTWNPGITLKKIIPSWP